MADDKKTAETGKSSGGQTAGSKTSTGSGSKSVSKPGGQKKG